MFGIKGKLQQAMNLIACENPYNAVKLAAASAAVIVAKLPPIADAKALRAAEILMMMSIFGHYGVKVSEASVRAFALSAFAKEAGSTAAYALLGAADALIIANPPVGYAIKLGVATSVITAVGISVIKAMEGSIGAKVATEIMSTFGMTADLLQITDVIERIGASPLDARIAKAQEKTAYWQKAIDEYIEMPDAEGGFIGEALMRNFWAKRQAKLLMKKIRQDIGK